MQVSLAHIRRFAMSLPEVTEEPHFKYTSFRVAGRIFATAPPDGKLLHVFIAEEARQAALALNPGFLQVLYWGKSVSGLRVELEKADMGVVSGLLRQAWTSKAPRSLSAASEDK